MKKFIAVVVFAMASFGASAGEVCNKVGDVGFAAADARDSGVPQRIAMAVAQSPEYGVDANKVLGATVKMVYSMPNKTPKEIKAITIALCVSSIGEL